MPFLKDKLVAIKKSQMCWGCARKFGIGVFLKYQVSVENGDFASWYLCPVCETYISNYGSELLDEDGYSCGEFRNEDRERWEETRVVVEGEVDLSIKTDPEVEK